MKRSSPIYKFRRKCQLLASKIASPEMLSRIYTKAVLKKDVDLKNPQTFNEKIQWMKIHAYPRMPLVVKCADKYAVRFYLKEKCLENSCVPILGAWNNAKDIKWEKLPQKFVLKCNHGCAYNILVPDKNQLDKKRVVKQLNKWIKEDFGAFNIERHYSQIKPRMIICEEFLGDCISDYKFFCFNGEPKFIYVSSNLIHDREAQIGFFYLNGQKMPLVRKDYSDIPSVTLPDFFNEMLEEAKILCKDFPFVRVDFFIANGRYYFAELTFTPSGGMMPFDPEHFDLDWGKMLDIDSLLIDEKYSKPFKKK